MMNGLASSPLRSQSPTSSMDCHDWKEPTTAERRDPTSLMALLTSTNSHMESLGTPATMETLQAEAQTSNTGTQNSVMADDDISCVINDLINFVDNFPTSTVCQGQPDASINPTGSILRPTSGARPSEPTGSRFHFSDYLSNNSFLELDKPKSTYDRQVLRENHHRSPANARALQRDRDSVNENVEFDAEIEASSKYSTGFVVSDDGRQKFNVLVKQVELALQEAWKERDEARAWAREIRETTQNWVNEQREQIEQEYMAAQNGAVRENDIESSPNIRYEARIERLESALQDIENLLKERRVQSTRCQEEELPRIAGKEFPVHSISTSWNGCKTQSGYFDEAPGSRRPRNFYPIDLPPETRIFQNENDYPAGAVAERPTSSFETPKPRLELAKKRYIGTTPGSFGLARRNIQPRDRSRTCYRDKDSCQVKLPLPSGWQGGFGSHGNSTIRYPNGDLQITSVSPTSSVAYYHAKSQVVRVENTDGSEIFEFPSTQQERHYPDGRKVVRFPDGTKKRYFPNGAVEIIPSSGEYSVFQHPGGRKRVTHF
jgi:T-complex protein 10 C-terminus